MKKKVLCSIMLLGVIGLSACGNDNDEISSVSNPDETSVLVNQLSSLNDSLMSTKGPTRAFLQPGWQRRGAILAGDIGGCVGGGRAGFYIGGLFGPQAAGAGAVIGAIIGGACGSATAYEATRAVDSDNFAPLKNRAICAYENSIIQEVDFREYAPKEIIVDYPTKDLNITQMGAKHNYVLKLVRDHQIVLDENSSCLSPEERYVLESEEFNSKVDDILTQVRAGYVSGKNMQFEGADVTTKVMNLFYDILAQYPTKINDVQFIINKYIEVIKASNEIDENDKNAIYMGLSVAASSTEFWEEELGPILEK